jgi:hypothetical protein
MSLEDIVPSQISHTQDRHCTKLLDKESTIELIEAEDKVVVTREQGRARGRCHHKGTKVRLGRITRTWSATLKAVCINNNAVLYS